MTCQTFTLRLQLLNGCLPGRWLCLDALLDAALMLEGKHDDDRILPVAAFDGETVIPPGQAAFDAVQSGKGIYMASAAMFLNSGAYKKGFVRNSSRDFSGETLPVVSEKGKELLKVDTVRGVAVNIISERIALSPGEVEWEGVGDPRAVSRLISSLPGIGAKTSHGFGRFENVRVSLTDGSAFPGIVDSETNSLMRPIPHAVARRVGNMSYTTRIETVRPPYHLRKNAVLAAVPISEFMNGILQTS